MKDFLNIDDFIISFFVSGYFTEGYEGPCKMASSIFNPDSYFIVIDGFLYFFCTTEIDYLLYLTAYFFIIEVFKWSTSGLANKLVIKSFFFAFWNP